MNSYRVRLEHPTAPGLWEERAIAARSVPEARRIAQALASRAASFTVLGGAVPLNDGTNAEVRVADLNVRDYAPSLAGPIAVEDRADAARDALKALREYHEVDRRGKVHGPTVRGRQHLHHHLLPGPYRVVGVEQLRPEAGLLVQQLVALHGSDPAAWKQIIADLQARGIPTAVVTGTMFGKTMQAQLDGSNPIVWSSATEKVALTTSTYTPDIDTHDFFNDVTNEVTGTGYTAGGATLGTKTSGYTAATDVAYLDAADTTWTTSTITARIAVVWNDTAGASTTDPVQGWVDFGADVSTTAGTFQITWDSTGIFTVDVT